MLAPLPGVLPAPVRRTLLYRQATGHLPPLLRPRTFTEKLNWRITLDRRELLAATCDKLAMKEHARRLAPGLVRVPQTLWSGSDVGELAQVPLPDHWVLKPNHSCIRRLFGRGPADLPDLRRRTAGWVQEQYWRKSEEWAYRRARPCLLVEQFVGVRGVVPADLKVLVVGGQPRLVELHTGRDGDHRTRLHSPEWAPLPWTIGYRPGPDADPPECLDDLLKAATALAEGFDMLRVDFYEVDGELWFGELTPYPGAGLSQLEPDLDVELGAAWVLPSLWRARR